MGSNLQYRRTHKAIIQAFLTLAQQKSFDSIRVQDILDEALVSRYTFYKHFKDKYEIAEYLQAQIMQELRAVMQRYREERADLEPVRKKQLDAYYQLGHQNEILSALWNIHTDTVDLEKLFRQEFYDRYLDWDLTQADRTNRALEATIYSSIQTTLVTYFTTHASRDADAFGEPLQEALLNVFLLLIRVSDPEQAAAALAPFIR